jgi:hypothetical protein
MTSTTAPTPSTAPTRAAAPRRAHRAGARFPAAALGTARRTILQFARTPQMIMLATVQGAAVLFLFRYIFGGAIDTVGGVDYVDFLVPGYLATTFLWNGMSGTAGVAEDAASGVHDRLRSLPVPRAAVMVGRSLGDMALTSWGLLATTLLGLAVGFRAHGSLGEVALAFALMLVAGYALTWVFISLGLVGQRAGGPGHVVHGGPALHVHVERLRAGRLAARLDAAHRRPPARHPAGERRAQPDAGRDRCRGRGPQHRLLGGPQPGVERGDPGRLRQRGRRTLRPAPLTVRATPACIVAVTPRP